MFRPCIYLMRRWLVRTKPPDTGTIVTSQGTAAIIFFPRRNPCRLEFAVADGVASIVSAAKRRARGNFNATQRAARREFGDRSRLRDVREAVASRGVGGPRRRHLLL